MINSADKYAEAVLAGDIPAGCFQFLAAKRHVMDRETGERRGLRFDAKLAGEACDFFGCLRLTTSEYAGQPFDLRKWQRFIIGSLWGWQRRDGLRRYRDAFISVARGNGKSPLAAGIGLQLAFCDLPKREPRAEVYAAATKRDQARIVFDEADRMVSTSGLRKLVEQRAANLSAPDDCSKFEPISADGKTADGRVIHGLIRDELHAWREQHRKLFDKLATAVGKRPQPMAVTITTAGDDLSEIWKEQLDYSRRVVEQVLDPPADDEWFGDEHFSFVCEVDNEDDIYDENNWCKANPMLCEPRSPVRIDHLRVMAAKAKAGSIVDELRFRQYHCNQLVASVEKPIDKELWNKGNRELPDLQGALAFGGIDLARSDDFCAVTLVFPLDDEEYAVKTWCWTVEHRSKELQSEEFRQLLRLPNITIHSGDAIEYADVREKIVELATEYYVQSWVLDYSWARETGQHLINEHGYAVEGMPQTRGHYNEPVTRFLDLLAKGKIRHGGCRLLGWQANNLLLHRGPDDLRMPDKKQSQYKIDSMVALFMALRDALISDRNTWTLDEAGL